MRGYRLDLAALNPGDIKGLLGPAVSIALLGMIESLLCGPVPEKWLMSGSTAIRSWWRRGSEILSCPFSEGFPRLRLSPGQALH